MTTALKNAPTGSDEQPVDGTAAGPDAESGKLFEVPRVAVEIDESDPTILKLSFSGSIEIDRGTANDVQIFNKLKAGETVALTVDAHVAGSKKTHRRDTEGDVDAIVETKSLIIHSLDTTA